MTPRRTSRASEKVYAYITHGDQLLVFRHVDFPDAGIQVPGGTVQAGESLPEAVLREAFEETGLAGLEIVAALGDTWPVMDDGGRSGVVHHRHFFHLRCTSALPLTWFHDERDSSDGGPLIRFAFFWVPLAAAPELLIADMGALVHQVQIPRQEAWSEW